MLLLLPMEKLPRMLLLLPMEKLPQMLLLLPMEKLPQMLLLLWRIERAARAYSALKVKRH